MCKLALELVARGRLRPVLERRGEEWLARWQPVTDDDADAARVALLVRSMPPLLRAELSSRNAGNPPEAVLHSFLAAAVDACARELLQGALGGGVGREPAAGVVEAWLLALAADDPVVHGDPWALAALAEQLEEWWAAGRRYATQRMFRTCFRLVPPDGDDQEGTPGTPGEPGVADPDDVLRPAAASERSHAADAWRVEFFLQHKDDPSVLVPAADVWAHSERLSALGRMLENPQERLLGGLGHAGGLA